MVRWLCLGCLIGALVILAGCNDSKTPTAKVSGTVKLDGEPLDEGTIMLYGDGGTAPDTFDVKNGKFEGQAKLGKKRVEIHAYKQGPKAKMDKEEIEGSGKEERIPARFNSESKVTAEVTGSGISPVEFKVESK